MMKLLVLLSIQPSASEVKAISKPLSLIWPNKGHEENFLKWIIVKIVLGALP